MEQSAVPDQSQQAPPGWYKDPTTGQDRYWDGTQWAQQTAPQSNVGALEICGYVFAVVFSLVGLILGIISTARGNRPHGPIIIGISAVFMILGLVIALSSA